MDVVADCGLGGGAVTVGLGGGVTDVVASGAASTGLGLGGGGDDEAVLSAVSALGVVVGGLGGGAFSPGFRTLSAAVEPFNAVKNVGGSSPSSRGRTLK